MADKMTNACQFSLVDTLSHLVCPCHDNGQGIKCYPCLYVRIDGRTYLRTFVPMTSLSKLNNFDQNFMKLGHIV